MNFFRRLSSTSKRRQSDTGTCPQRRHSREFEDVHDQVPGDENPPRSRSLSLGTVFSRNPSRQHSSEHYTTDFWVRNFSDKSVVPWLEFRAAFVLDYKNNLKEFSDTGHLSCVLDAAKKKLCNKDAIVYVNRYKKFVGSDGRPDAVWNKIKEEATRRLFEEALEDSLCL